MKKSPSSSPDNERSQRTKLYYGWVMVPVAVIAQAVTGVGQTYGISVFNPSIQFDLGISLSALTGAYLVGTLLASLPQPYLGSLMDRFGIRRTMLAIVLLLGGACLVFSRVSSLPALFGGFFLLRLLGQGGLSLLAGNIPAMWFRRKLGTVTGIVSAGFSISMAVIPPFFLYLVNRSGWRTAYANLGFLVWLIMLPLILFVIKDKPELVGQEIDGGDDVLPDHNQKSTEDVRDYSLKEAQRTPAYWILLVNSSLWAMVVTAIFFNLLRILAARGISDQVAAATYTTYAAASLVTQLSLGSLANKGPLQVLLMICMATLGISAGVLSIANTTLLAHVYSIIIGISTGLIALTGGTMFARYFGRTHLGKLRGGVLTAQVAGSSLGPFITGLVFDLTGSFQYSLWIFMALLIPAALISLKAVQPQLSTRITPGPT